jgi:hypothetical protein
MMLKSFVFILENGRLYQSARCIPLAVIPGSMLLELTQETAHEDGGYRERL